MEAKIIKTCLKQDLTKKNLPHVCRAYKFSFSALGGSAKGGYTSLIFLLVISERLTILINKLYFGYCQNHSFTISLFPLGYILRYDLVELNASWIKRVVKKRSEFKPEVSENGLKVQSAGGQLESELKQ